MRQSRKLSRIALLLLCLGELDGIAAAATVPIGPPTGLSDPLPTPLRSRWVDRCGRGVAGICGSVACSDAGDCTNQNAPCCTLHYGAGRTDVRAGDRIYVRAGADASDVYKELDSENGKWGFATLGPFVKGTARCAGGTNSGWSCTSDAGCPGSACAYNPVQLIAYPEADGSRAAIDPGGTTPPTTGGTNCWGGTPGHYVGIDFNISTCGSTIGNDRTECYGGSQEGKPCSSLGDCPGGVACAPAPWYWIVDGFTFSNWTYYDPDPTHTNHTAYCTHKPFQVGYDHGCPVTVSITLQNSTFIHNAGGGLIWSRGGAGNRWLHNTVYGNHTHGYDTALDHWEAQDTKRNRTTYMWNNVIHDNADTPPPFCMAQACQDAGTHPVFTCLDGDNTGQPCRSESDCPVGHCGPICYTDPYHNSGTASQGYDCPCQNDDQCAPGLSCQSIGGGLVGCPANECDCTASTEGRGIIVDRGGSSSSVDIRNNLIYGNEGDCMSLFLSDAHGVISNNTCFHNAKKNGTYAELWYAGNYSNVWNNLFVPTVQAACDGNGVEHGTGGHACSHYLSNDVSDCGGGTVSLGCNPTGIQYYDGGGLWTWGEPSLPATNFEGNNLVFWNSNTIYGTIADPPTFFYGSGAKGQLSDYQAYGTSTGLTRGKNEVVADPLFLSTNPADPKFLSIPANSPAARAGNATFAPTFDITGAPRPNPPSIGAFEPSAVTVTSTTTGLPTTIPATSTSVATTTTAKTTTTTAPPVAGGAPPVNWGNDPSTVALWTFEGGSTKNVSTSTRYCNPASQADLSLYNGTIAFDTANRREGAASFSFDGNTTLASSADCLRQNGPDQWTLTLWARSTSSSAPYPMLVFNRDESGARYGFFVTYVGANGQTYACLDTNSVDTCSTLFPSVFTPDGSWHFSATQYTGTQLNYALDGAAFSAPVTVAYTPNTGTYPFQLSHVVGPGTGTGVIGNGDEVWWTDAVLTQQQVCRVRAVGVQGIEGWCAGSAWANCNGDEDCGGRAGACNTAFPGGGKSGTCVGNLLTAAQGGPSGCNTVAALGSCDAVLTAGPGPTTTSTSAVTTTTKLTTTTTGVATTTTTTTSTTSTTAPAPGVDLGIDPSRLLTQYQVQNLLAPVYQVYPTTSGPAPFNDVNTPELYPCALQNLDVQVLVTSAAGGTLVYPQVAVRLYTSGGSPITSKSGGVTIDQVAVDMASLAPGVSAMADATVISSVAPSGELLFAPGDMPRNRAFRMEITVTPYADPQYTQPVPDVNPRNDVMSFWVLRAC